MEQYEGRVQIGRRRVDGGLAAIAMGVFAAALALTLIYMVTGTSNWYDAAWWVELAGALVLAGTIVPGLAALASEARTPEGTVAHEDDGRLVVMTTALMVALMDLALRWGHGAVVGGELGTATALTVIVLGLMAFAAPLGDALADRFPARRPTLRVTRAPEAPVGTTSRDRERIER